MSRIARLIIITPALVLVALVAALVLPLVTSASGPAAQPVTPAAAPGDCPAGAHLTIFEDGSAACYADGATLDRYPVTVDGTPVSWPADTFPWDCRTMGNRVCGPTTER